MANSYQKLIQDVRLCRHCEAHLPLGPKPIVHLGPKARILIIGQAPGRRVHQTGVPWNDPSGDKLREWMGIDRNVFYDASKIAIMPMGFCYPGTGPSGDLPPREECAPLWHEKILSFLNQIKMTLLIGQYSQKYYLFRNGKASALTETVKNWKKFRPQYLPLPHPSPRNRFWLKKNPWFEKEVVPFLRRQVSQILKS